MRDETERLIVALTDLAAALRATSSGADGSLAGLTAASVGTSRDELSAAIARARQAAEGSNTAGLDLDEAADALRLYLDRVF